MKTWFKFLIISFGIVLLLSVDIDDPSKYDLTIQQGMASISNNINNGSEIVETKGKDSFGGILFKITFLVFVIIYISFFYWAIKKSKTKKGRKYK